MTILDQIHLQHWAAGEPQRSHRWAGVACAAKVAAFHGRRNLWQLTTPHTFGVMRYHLRSRLKGRIKMNPCSLAVMSESSDVAWQSKCDFVAKKTRMRRGLDWTATQILIGQGHVYIPEGLARYRHIAGGWIYFYFVFLVSVAYLAFYLGSILLVSGSCKSFPSWFRERLIKRPRTGFIDRTSIDLNCWSYQ